jgi:xylan 1,4-beta-xylosidase
MTATTPMTTKNPGTAAAPGVPVFTPRDETAKHVRAALVEVDASTDVGELIPIWASIGYDEFNWTYTPTGKRLLGEFATSSAVPYHVRPHYAFISGTGLSLPHWGSGNVYHEDENGVPFYDFTLVDRAYDAIVGAGHHLLVELGFTPVQLLPEEAIRKHTIIDSPTIYSAYEAGQWAYPPKDYAKWGELVAALARHSLERYGEEEVSTWLWELWNEPDIFYWHGTREQFFELYEVTASAVRSVLPSASVGGPAVTGGPDGTGFLRDFLTYVSAKDLPLDFVSFHTKGSQFTPWRTYSPMGAPAPVQQSPSTIKMLAEIRSLLRVMAEFPRFAGLPAIVDECDAAVPAHWGSYDNANFGFQNTEYYPVFQAQLMKLILDLNSEETASVQRATSWSFYFEGERCFEGTRAFLTYAGIEKPLLNAYRALGQLGNRRLRAESSAGWKVTDLDATLPGTMPETIDALASKGDDGQVAVIVYRHTDDQYQTDDENASVELTISGLGPGSYEVSHFRVDRDHSNAHTVWRDIGSPEYPSAEQVEIITARQGLESAEPPRVIDSADGIVSISLRMSLPSFSLVTLRAL